MLRCAVLFAFLFASGCGREAPATKPASTQPTSARTTAPATGESPAEAAGIRYLERITGGASAPDTLPLIVAIHGLGDRPESFVRLFDGFQARARVIVPYGEPYGDGFSWFPTSSRAEMKTLSAGVERAAERLAPLITALASARPTAGKPIVTGFSQGGMLSFALAVLHPEVIGEAYPVSGFLPPPLVPSSWPVGKVIPPILAFHGDADHVVPVVADRDGVRKLREIGFSIDLHEYERVDHTVSAEMRRDLYAALAAASDRASRR